MLISKQEKARLEYYDDLKACIEYSNDMQDVYENIEEYNPEKKHKVLTVFDDLISGMISNKKLNLVLTELFIRGRTLNISIVFIIQSRCFHYTITQVSKVRLNTKHTFLL